MIDYCEWILERVGNGPFFPALGRKMEWILNRMGEASTWKGIGWLLVAAGVVPPGSVDLLVAAGVALVGVVEVLKEEK